MNDFRSLGGSGQGAHRDHELYEVDETPDGPREVAVAGGASRRALPVVVLGVLCLALAGALLWSLLGRHESRPQRAPSRPAATASSTPAPASSPEETEEDNVPPSDSGTSAPSVDAAQAPKIEKDATAALNAYGATSGKSQQDWSKQLKPHLTAKAAGRMGRQQPGPQESVTSLQVTRTDDTVSSVTATMSNGESLSANLVLDPDSNQWKLDLVWPTEGVTD